MKTYTITVTPTQSHISSPSTRFPMQFTCESHEALARFEQVVDEVLNGDTTSIKTGGTVTKQKDIDKMENQTYWAGGIGYDYSLEMTAE